MNRSSTYQSAILKCKNTHVGQGWPFSGGTLIQTISVFHIYYIHVHVDVPVVLNSQVTITFKVEENTAQSMKMLMEIDTVKTRMQDASRALKV